MRTLGILLGFALTSFSATPVLAWHNFQYQNTSQTIRNTAFITSSIKTGAFTGGNTQLSGLTINRASVDDIHNMSAISLTSGAAETNTTSRLLVNTDSGCGCTPSRYTRTTESNFAMVKTSLESQSDTGMNIQQTGISIDKAHVDDVSNSEMARMTTGNASTTTTSLTLVNVQWNGSF